MRGVYCIHCLVTDKKYVGSSIDIERRINAHFHPSRSKGRSNPLYTDIDTYGRDMFVCGLIEECDDNIKERERYWIEYYNTMVQGYNMVRSYRSEEENINLMRENSKLGMRNKRARETPEERRLRLDKNSERGRKRRERQRRGLD